MELGRQRAQVRAATVHRKEEEKKAKGKEGASSSTLKVVGKGVPKRKVFFFFWSSLGLTLVTCPLQK